MIKAKIEKNTLVSCLDTDGYVIIPKEVQIIGEGAFEGTQVMAVILHDDVKVIKKNAFTHSMEHNSATKRNRLQMHQHSNVIKKHDSK